MVEKIKRDVRITHDLRGHLGDHGDDDRARALAGAPQVRAATTTTRSARELEALHASIPTVGADIAALAHHALAELLERCRVERLTRHQHVLLRLGALIAQAEGAARARPPRAAGGRQAAAPEGRRGACAPARWRPRAACTRASAALAIATEAVRLVAGADGELGELEQRLDLAAIHAPRPACSPTSARSPTRSTGACARDPERQDGELS